MKRNILNLAGFCILSTILALSPTLTFGQGQSPENSAKPQKETKASHRSHPFKGKVGAVDKSAMTFTVGDRTFQITSETKITKDGKPATLQDAVVGEEVGGSAKKGADGKLSATSVRFGAKPEAEKKSKTKEPKKKEAKPATNAAPAVATPAM